MDIWPAFYRTAEPFGRYAAFEKIVFREGEAPAELAERATRKLSRSFPPKAPDFPTGPEPRFKTKLLA